jgi:hypothetical protein
MLCLEHSRYLRSLIAFLLLSAWTFESFGATAVSISRVGADVELRWSNLDASVDVERSARLGPTAAWEVVAVEPTQNGGVFTLRITPSENAQFFRLKAAGSVARILATSPAEG